MTPLEMSVVEICDALYIVWSEVGKVATLGIIFRIISLSESCIHEAQGIAASNFRWHWREQEFLALHWRHQK